MTFWVLFAFDAVLAAVLMAFFFIGIGDGSVSSFNIGLWLALLAAAGAILGGSLMLNARNHSRMAIALLLIPALPGLTYLAFVLMMIVMQPSPH